MPRLLLVQSSPNLENSVTRALSEKFVQTWVANYAGVDVDVLDVAAEPLPHSMLQPWRDSPRQEPKNRPKPCPERPFRTS